VALDPADVHDQAFRIVFRGYDVPAVDAFLDRVQAELAQRHTQPAHPAGTAGGEELRTRDDDGAAARALRTLTRAEQTAEQVVADAAAEAEQLRTAARAEAEEIVAAARTESSRLEAELQLRRQQEVGALVLETQQLRAEIDRLGDLERRLRGDLQAWLAEHQRTLERHAPVVGLPSAGTLRADLLDPAA
jgi:DivIVA domain-containing protein